MSAATAQAAIEAKLVAEALVDGTFHEERFRNRFTIPAGETHVTGIFWVDSIE